jgi:PASTA domain
MHLRWTASLLALGLVLGTVAACRSDAGDDRALDPTMIRKLLGPPAENPQVSHEMVAVPQVVGTPEDRAVRELRRRGLHVAPRFSGTVGNPHLKPTGCYSYASQGPAPGTRVPRGSSVAVTVVLCSEVNGDADRLSGEP